MANPKAKQKKIKKQKSKKLGPFAPDSSGKLNILRHNGDSLSMNCTEVSVFKESNQISLSSFLKSRDSTALESQICFEVLRDLSNQSLKRKLSNQKLCTFLILPDFPKSNSSWSEPVGLLHTAGCRSRLSSSLRCQLLPGSLAACRFTGCLLSTGHLEDYRRF